MTADLKRKLHVLIVENNPVDSKVLVDMLSRSTYGSFEANTSESLEDAIQILAQDHYDVILLDLNLKDSRGLDTLFRMTEIYPHLPIVVNTGVYEDDLGLRAVTTGAQDYLIKGKYKPYGLSKSLYYAVERKKAEEDLKCAYVRLQEAQSQLIQAEKLNVIGSISSGVAHEVKNPLATILYGVEYLGTKITDPDEKIQITLKSIREAAQKANDIIKDLLDFASLSSLQQQPEDLNEVVEQSLSFIRYHCDNRSMKIIKDYDPQLPRVRIDKNRIQQVLIDVILNAIHVMSDGGQVTLRTYARELIGEDASWLAGLENRFKPGDSVVIIDIEDVGPGIPEENIPKIFDPFFTTRRADGGVGLGLSIARTIMRSHDGSITLQNIEGGARARLLFRK